MIELVTMFLCGVVAGLVFARRPAASQTTPIVANASGPMPDPIDLSAEGQRHRRTLADVKKRSRL